MLLLAGFALLFGVVVQTTHAALVDQVDTRIWAAKSRMGSPVTRPSVTATGTEEEDPASSRTVNEGRRSTGRCHPRNLGP